MVPRFCWFDCGEERGRAALAYILSSKHSTLAFSHLVVAVVLVEHVGGSGLDLGVEDGEPELLGLDGAAEAKEKSEVSLNGSSI